MPLLLAKERSALSHWRRSHKQYRNGVVLTVTPHERLDDSNHQSLDCLFNSIPWLGSERYLLRGPCIVDIWGPRQLPVSRLRLSGQSGPPTSSCGVTVITTSFRYYKRLRLQWESVDVSLVQVMACRLFGAKPLTELAEGPVIWNVMTAMLRADASRSSIGKSFCTHFYTHFLERKWC